MAIRTALLNGNVINKDSDFSKYIEAVSEAGVIEGLAVSSSQVATGKCFVPCERSNGDTIFALVYVSTAQSISGDGDVYVKVSQEIIDNGELGNEDGTGIATIEVGTMPSKNALKLAVITSGEVEDKRNMIKKVGELLQMINTNIDYIEDLDTRVEALEEADAINHLEESGLVGELYSLTDKMFKQFTPKISDCTLDVNIGDSNDNKQIHIQRIGSGTASNKLKLKVKSVGSPTTGLVVEVRKGVQVTVTANEEAYWYGGDLVASGSIAYGDISNTYSEKEITLNANFGGIKGELLDIVVYQTGNVINASNYYCIAYDSTQYSEGFSLVAVNGDTRVRKCLMPYCISDGFSETMLAKAEDYSSIVATYQSTFVDSSIDLYTVQSTHPVKCILSLDIHRQYYGGSCRIYVNGTQIAELSNDSSYSTKSFDYEFSVKTGDNITLTASTNGEVSNVKLNLFETKGDGYIEVYPIEKVNLGKMGYATLYGIHTDNKFKGGIMTGKTTTATTGSITLGNAVGFITVNLNGEIVKIPYYSE